MKKISTLFEKNPTNLGRVVALVNPDNAWVYQGEAIATRKFDGTATAIINGEPYKRYDAKKGKEAPAGAIPCQEADALSGHHPHWVKADRANNADKWLFEAFDAMTSPEDGTYELCGERVGRNDEKIVGHQLIRHGSEVLTLPEQLTFDSLRDFLTENDIEGIVFHHVSGDGRMCKLRKKDFGIKR